MSIIPQARGISIIPGEQEPYIVFRDNDGDLRYADISLIIKDPVVLRQVTSMCWQLRELLPDQPDIFQGEAAYEQAERELRGQYGIEFCGVNGLRILP